MREHSVWRIAVGTARHPADSLSGNATRMAGGRWTSRGIAAVYCSEHISLAALEVLAHLNSANLPLRRFVIQVTIPDDMWAGRELLLQPPDDWTIASFSTECRGIGDTWVKMQRSALLEVPSVTVPEEKNVLLNPRHPDAAKIRGIVVREWLFDVRLT
jgi:RES domain-containing protein